jgi:hypothetical protein
VKGMNSSMIYLICCKDTEGDDGRTV